MALLNTPLVAGMEYSSTDFEVLVLVLATPNTRSLLEGCALDTMTKKISSTRVLSNAVLNVF